MLPEEGHLLPTFKLAKQLQSRGHHVRYLVTQRDLDYVSAQGVECISIPDSFWLTNGLPRDIGLKGSSLEGIAATNSVIFDRQGEMVQLLRDLRSDLLIVDPFIPVVAPLAYDNGIPIIFLNVSYDIGVADLVLDNLLRANGTASGPPAFLTRVPELILCPREFEFSNLIKSERPQYYCEALIDLERVERPFSWEGIDREKPLIYCAMGSQAHSFAGSKRFFQTMIDAMRIKTEWQMILSVGKYHSTEFENVPGNVRVVNWVPQLEVLRRAKSMITHGGMGTIKECIIMGVPMIVFPMVRNQPMSGARVVYHGLGVRGDIHTVTVEQVQSMIERIVHDDTYRERVVRMGQKFREMEENGKGVRIIEKMLEVLEKKRSACGALAQ